MRTLVNARLTERFSSSLSTGTAVEISGIWKACPPGKEQTHELQTTEVAVVGAADPEVSMRCESAFEGNNTDLS